MLLNAQSSSGPESLAALTATDLLVEARALNGEGAHDTTLTMAQNVVALKRRLFGEEHQEVATSLRNLGTVLIAAGEYERAREEFERAVHVIERSDPPNALGLADALNGLGDAEIRTEHYDAAEKTLARALGLSEQVGPSHRLVAQALERRGFLLLQKGAYARGDTAAGAGSSDLRKPRSDACRHSCAAGYLGDTQLVRGRRR